MRSGDDGKISIDFHGPTAIFAAVVILLGGAFKYVTSRQTLGTEAVAKVQEEIAIEYLRGIQARKDLSLEESAELSLQTREVEIASIAARGSGDDVVVRVEVKPHPTEPPGVEHVRYFDMRHSTLLGWRVEREAKALSYYTKIF